ncbi:hypothetical protein Cgig2_003392 [Carnegiea gigantea]|uniref:Uncharacterized protein n=1 Tax=Carnegiea gigantea TaxID=171969 RepID=A0A9Q1JPX6_9CARY|nr:hypothetical protein Cgig2_003392 [Carnegiea gigantea]
MRSRPWARLGGFIRPFLSHNNDLYFSVFNFFQMVEHCSTAVNAAIITLVRATTDTSNKYKKGHMEVARNTPIVVAKDLMTSNLFQRKRQTKMTSTESRNGLGNKSSMSRFDKNIHTTCFMERDANMKVHIESSTTTGKSTDSSLIGHSSIKANSSDGDLFNPMRHFSGFANHGFPPPSIVHKDDVENDGIDADNDDNDDASLFEYDALSSSED